jgi:hypothetical protein
MIAKSYSSLARSCIQVKSILVGDQIHNHNQGGQISQVYQPAGEKYFFERIAKTKQVG